MKLKVKIADDLQFVKIMRQKIKENEGYCPCQVQKNEDTKCMCKAFKDQKTEGWCHCGLYYKYDIGKV